MTSQNLDYNVYDETEKVCMSFSIRSCLFGILCYRK